MLGQAGLLQRLVRVDEAERVKQRVDFFDAGQRIADQVDRRQQAGSEFAGQQVHGRIAQIKISTHWRHLPKAIGRIGPQIVIDCRAESVRWRRLPVPNSSTMNQYLF